VGPECPRDPGDSIDKKENERVGSRPDPYRSSIGEMGDAPPIVRPRPLSRPLSRGIHLARAVAAKMRRRPPILAPAAIGLVLANALSIVVVIGCCLTTARATELRDRALAALALTDSPAAGREITPARLETAIRAAAPRLRTKRLDRMLLLGGVGVIGSALCTWHLVRQSAKQRPARPLQRR
jgi:hypothetical protein